MTEHHPRDCLCPACEHHRHRAPGLADTFRWLRERREHYKQSRDPHRWTPLPDPPTFGEYCRRENIGTAPRPLDRPWRSPVDKPRSQPVRESEMGREVSNSDTTFEPIQISTVRTRYLPTQLVREPHVLVSPNGDIVSVYYPDDWWGPKG